MDCGETCPFPGVVESPQVVVSQREVPMAPFHIGAGALEDFRERFGLVLEMMLRQRAQTVGRVGARPALAVVPPVSPFESRRRAQDNRTG